MRIKFLGAIAGEVTGSCTLLHNEKTGAKFLVDCGATQGPLEEVINNQPFAFDPREIRYVLLTHAHQDHCGRIPMLYEQGFVGKVICNLATAELVKTQLKDAASTKRKAIGEKFPAVNDGKKKRNFAMDNHLRTHPYDRALSKLSSKVFQLDDWFYCLDGKRAGYKPGILFPIDNDLFVSFLRSSHMLGAVAMEITLGMDKGTVCFSGDVGCNWDKACYQPLLKRQYTPHEKCEYVVLESTYGQRERRENKYQDFDARIEKLREIILEKYDTFIFPCFAMQRTQDVLFDIVCMIQNEPRLHQKCDIYLDSFLAEKICGIYKWHLRSTVPEEGEIRRRLNGEFAARFGKADEEVNAFVESVLVGEDGTVGFVGIHRGKGCHEKGSVGNKKIIITSSGMCHAGPILNHLVRLREEKTALILTGFQGTENGKNLKLYADQAEQDGFDGMLKIKEGGKVVPKPLAAFKLKINGDDGDEEMSLQEIKGAVKDMSPYYSGHADVNKLQAFIFENTKKHGFKSKSKPEVTVFLNHGDDGARKKLKQIIEERSGENLPGDCRKVSRVELPYANSGWFDLGEGEWVGD